MRKETKALLQENNQQETLLFPDFQSVLNNMVTYLRSTRLPYSLQEQARQQIIQLFLAEQEKGASPDEVIGMDFNTVIRFWNNPRGIMAILVFSALSAIFPCSSLSAPPSCSCRI